MRVSLIKKDLSSSLTFEKEYIVLSIEIQNSDIGFVSYRLIPDEGCPILLPSRLFKITSHKLSSNWIPRQKGIDFYTIQPEKWSRDGFWEDYYNDESEALRDFKVEKEKIFTEES